MKVISPFNEQMIGASSCLITHILSYFNTILCYKFHLLVIAIVHSNDLSSPVVQANYLTSPVHSYKTIDTIVTMRSGKYLDIQFFGKHENNLHNWVCTV